MYRENTKEIAIGNVKIGGTHPVTIQSMTNTKTENVKETVDQILRLEAAGCEIIRCAVPTMEAAEALKEIKKQIHIPLVADIHFDYRLAIAAIENGADKIRINPGNIGSEEKVQAVVDKAKEYNVPIRVGVNSGSLEKHILEKYNGVTAEGIVESALDKVHMIEKMGYDNLVVSIIFRCADVRESSRIDRKGMSLSASCRYYRIGNGLFGKYKIFDRSWDHPQRGDRKYDPGFFDRRSGRRDSKRKAYIKNTWFAKRRDRSCILSYLRQDEDRSDRSGKRSGEDGSGYSS